MHPRLKTIPAAWIRPPEAIISGRSKGSLQGRSLLQLQLPLMSNG